MEFSLYSLKKRVNFKKKQPIYITEGNLKVKSSLKIGGKQQ